MKTFAKIRFYWDAFVIATIVGLGMIPLISIFPKHKGSIMHNLNKLIMILIGGKLETVGDKDPSAQLFVMNHQGIIDIIGMEALQDGHLNWIAKRELFEIPWYGLLLKKGDMISVDREDKKALLELLSDVKKSIFEKGRAVALFPEGTRAKDQELLEFKPGTRFIAKKLGLIVQPVVISGSKELLNEHNRTAHSSTVKYIYLPSIDVKTAEKNWYDKMQQDMQKTIDEELEKNSRHR